MTLDSWLSAANGDASGFWFMSLMADMAFPKSFVWGDVASRIAGRRRGREALLRHGRRTDGSILGDPGTEFIWAGGRLADGVAVATRATTSTAACGLERARRS